MVSGWITFVETDEEGDQAMVLLTSLRRFSSKEIMVVYGPEVTKLKLTQLRLFSICLIPLFLWKGFDASDNKTKAKLFCLSLDGYESMAYADPRLVVLANMDFIFGNVGPDTVLLPSRNPESLPFFVFQPHASLGTDVMKIMASSSSSLGDIYSALGKVRKFRKMKSSTCPDFYIFSTDMDDPQYRDKCSLLKIESYERIKKELDNIQLPLLKLENVPRKKFPEPIAIVGLSCRFPCANNQNEFWKLLMSGDSGVRPRPQTRWTWEQGCRLDSDSGSREVGWLSCPVDEFDAAFFGVSPTELKFTDPQHRLILEVAHESLEDAGIPVDSLRAAHVGVYTGIWKDDYKDLMIETGFKGTEFYRSYMGTGYSPGSARLSLYLGVTGPNLVSEAGCSASFVALNSAVESLRRGETSLCLASAVNLILHPFRDEDMKAITSSDCKCKTFDVNANGFARAEGVATLVLKRLSDVKHTDRVYGLIRGIGVSQDGGSPSLGTPTVEGEALSMTLALNSANVTPGAVEYVEAHGTGTKVGDPIEIAAIAKVYGQDRERPLLIGSVKTNIGHTEACAGMAGLIKVLLAFKNDQLPPHINVKTLNPSLPFHKIPASVNLKPVPWMRAEGRSRFAGISNFGISGANTHLILEEPPANEENQKLIQPPHHILTLSAKTPEALSKLVIAHEVYFREAENERLSSVAFTLNCGRMHYKRNRMAVVGNSFLEFADKLAKENYYSTLKCSSIPMGEELRICFLFPGQGSQYTGMGKQLYQYSAQFAQKLDQVNSYLRSSHGIDIKKAIFEGSHNSNLHDQLGIFAVEYGLLGMWASWGIRASLFLGHSLGEFAAAVGAGIMSVEAALDILVVRARLTSSLPPGSMVAVEANRAETEKLLQEFGMEIDIAAENSENQTVVAGVKNDVQKFLAFCRSKGKLAKELPSSVAYHSRQLDPIISDLETSVKSVAFGEASVPVLSSVLGTISKKMSHSSYWVEQTRKKVQFHTAARIALQKANIFLEVGPTPVLSAFVKECAKNDMLVINSLSKREGEWLSVLSAVGRLYTAGVNVNWNKIYEGHAGRIVSLPHYPWQRKKYWMSPLESMTTTSQTALNLLGRKVEDTEEWSKFVCNLSLGTLPYISYHKIGETPIFPGAGYIAMALETAKYFGYNTLVRNVRFIAPLALGKDEREVETVVNGMRLEIMTRNRLDGKRTLHADAELANSLELNLPQVDQECITALLATEAQDLGDHYKNLCSLGYNFGAPFRPLCRVWKKKGEVLVEVQLATSIEHPITIDAVLQTCVLVNGINGLELPSAVGQYRLLNIPQGPLSFIYFNSKGSFLLLDAEYNAVAELKDMATTPTSLEALARLNNFPNPVPIYEETLIPDQSLPISIHGWRKMWKKETRIQQISCSNVEIEALNALSKDVGLGIFSVMKDLGWNFSKAEIVTPSSTIDKLNLVTRCEKFLNRIFEILEEEGILRSRSDSGMEYEIVSVLPSSASLNGERESLKSLIHSVFPTEWAFTQHYLNHLPSILRGTLDSLQLLFPPEGIQTVKFSAQEFYVQGESSRMLLDCFKTVMCTVLDPEATQFPQSGVLRILEVGAGTGSATSVLLSILDGITTNFSYTYTDISAAYFGKAEKKFSKFVAAKQLNFQVFNVEECPESQGFIRNSYHIVVASNVLHATEDLRKSVANVRALLLPSGCFVFAETFVPLRHYDVIVGHLDGYWRFKDDVRTRHCLVDEKRWAMILNEHGFQHRQTVSTWNSSLGVMCAEATSCPSEIERKSWIIFGQDSFLRKALSLALEGRGKCVAFVENAVEFFGEDCQGGLQSHQPEGIVYTEGISDKDPTLLCANLMHLLQTALKGPCAKVVVLTKGVFRPGNQSIFLPNAGTLSGLLRSFQSEFPHIACKLIDLDPMSENFQELETAEAICSEVFLYPKEMLCHLKGGTVYRARMKKLEKLNAFPSLNPPRTNYCLTSNLGGSLKDLSFQPLPVQALQPDEVAVEIKAVGLNFHDLLTLLGSKEGCRVGWDMAGVVASVGIEVKDLAVGDQVVGIPHTSSPANKLPSCLITKAVLLLKLPRSTSLLSAVTWPLAFSTANHALVTKAGLKKGDKVLIHTATGAVGLQALQIAKEIGAEIYATAGSSEKRAFLKSCGVSHTRIFSSRDHSFTIIGPIVDVLLNTLTGPGFKEASISVCRPGARFLELSSLNIWNEQDFPRNDVTYYKIDLTDVTKPLDHVNSVWPSLIPDVRRRIEEGQEPVPTVSFPVERVRDSFLYLQEAKHIGKVVLTYGGLFCLNSTYLITGGFGGIGIAVADWMLSKGARIIILASRSVDGEDKRQAINDLRKKHKGAHVLACQLDVSNLQECVQLLRRIEETKAPLKGIFHCAGTLADFPFPEQNLCKLTDVLNPKMAGAWNLHELTKGMRLNQFVLFSSFAGIAGPPGQANHAAASSFLDTLSRYRRSLGLPTTSINWGQWGEVGIVAQARIGPYTPMKTKNCLEVLEDSICSQRCNVVAADGIVSRWASVFPWMETYIEQIQREKEKGVKGTETARSFWDLMDETQHPYGLIQETSINILSSLLQISPEDIPLDSELGLDSLLKIELRNAVQVKLKPRVKVSSHAFHQCSSLKQVTEKLAELVRAGEGTNTGLGSTQLKEIIRLHSCPSSEIMELSPSTAVGKVSTIKHVLLCGATGALGPYILSQLSRMSNIKEIYCLVRAVSEQKAHTRVMDQLKLLDLWEETDCSKVIPVVGDISRPYLGLSAESYNSLASVIDGVINVAADTGHLEEYSSSSNVYFVNVQGVQELLKFCMTEKSKHFFHGSTYAVIVRAKTYAEQNAPEGWLEENEVDEIPKFGYITSKFIAERIIEKVVKETKISAKVFRFPLISGRSGTGKQIVKKSHFFLKYVAYLRSGIMPNVEFPAPVLPVDKCAEISLRIFFDDLAPSDVYNVVCPNVPSEFDILNLAPKLGFSLRKVDYEEFSRFLQDNATVFGPLKQFYTETDRFPALLKAMTILEPWKGNKHSYFASKKVLRFVPDLIEICGDPLLELKKGIEYALEDLHESEK